VGEPRVPGWGFDTCDSCYRARHIFGVSSAGVVTQGYQCRVPYGKMIHYQAREVLADVKAMWDADVSNPTPVMGGHEQLNLQPVA
jgi:vancomycin permeability regulator SanA